MLKIGNKRDIRKFLNNAKYVKQQIM